MCKQCETKPVYEFTNKRKLCRRCFIKYFQKKVLYTIRKFKLLGKGDIVYSTDPFMKELLSLFEDKGIIELTKNKKKATKIIVNDSIDDNSDKIIHLLIKGKLEKNNRLSPIDGKIIKPFYLFLDDEIQLYAKLKKIKLDKKFKPDKISVFIESLEKKHPEVKRAIVNSYLELFLLNPV